jgi:hypothetical protein
MTEPFRRLGKLPGLIEPVGLTPYRAWGWKNPGSLFHMPLLVDFFPELKFVLVIRHGLDMAYSSLQGQPVYWSWLYQLPPVSYPVPPAHMLAFWVRANQAAIAIGEERLRNRFLVLNFDMLCASPETEIDRLIEFSGLPVSGETRETLIKLPRVPGSTGRYKDQDRSTLAPENVEAVRELGFDIED